MLSLQRIVIDIIILVVVVATAVYVYQVYGDDVRTYIFGSQQQILYVEDTAIPITVARTPAERQQGLSGVAELDDLEGKFFIFEEEDTYGIWMKDMLFAIDIIWINNNLEIVHIEENVSPDTYPTVFRPDEPARFVLETNAFFADTLSLVEGDRITVPSLLLPLDIREDVTQ